MKFLDEKKDDGLLFKFSTLFHNNDIDGLVFFSLIEFIFDDRVFRKFFSCEYFQIFNFGWKFVFLCACFCCVVVDRAVFGNWVNCVSIDDEKKVNRTWSFRCQLKIKLSSDNSIWLLRSHFRFYLQQKCWMIEQLCSSCLPCCRKEDSWHFPC